MTIQFETPAVAASWADSRETHPAVAMAIHAISDNVRTPHAIWECPTQAEWDHVAIAVQNYVESGAFAAEEDGRYPWGSECVFLDQ
jgi:hypothetical protein